ncbi:MAG: hypothetical protein ACRDGG_04875 [Anaerolineae bacterium]
MRDLICELSLVVALTSGVVALWAFDVRLALVFLLAVAVVEIIDRLLSLSSRRFLRRFLYVIVAVVMVALALDQIVLQGFLSRPHSWFVLSSIGFIVYGVCITRRTTGASQ